jgi:hypothetical protein
MAKLETMLLGPVGAAMSGAMGKENRGFGLGLIPGLMYQNDYRKREEEEEEEKARAGAGMKKGGKVKKMAKGGKVTRGDGICKKGHTKGKMV